MKPLLFMFLFFNLAIVVKSEENTEYNSEVETDTTADDTWAFIKSIQDNNNGEYQTEYNVQKEPGTIESQPEPQQPEEPTLPQEPVLPLSAQESVLQPQPSSQQQQAPAQRPLLVKPAWLPARLPVQPVQPQLPVQPQPVQPVQPQLPVQPQPVQPVQPQLPVQPQPVQPVQTQLPVQPQPVQPDQPQVPSGQAQLPVQQVAQPIVHVVHVPGPQAPAQPAQRQPVIVNVHYQQGQKNYDDSEEYDDYDSEEYDDYSEEDDDDDYIWGSSEEDEDYDDEYDDYDEYDDDSDNIDDEYDYDEDEDDFTSSESKEKTKFKGIEYHKKRAQKAQKELKQFKIKLRRRWSPAMLGVIYTMMSLAAILLVSGLVFSFYKQEISRWFLRRKHGYNKVSVTAEENKSLLQEGVHV